jgi:hypothetical protein
MERNETKKQYKEKIKCFGKYLKVAIPSNGYLSCVRARQTKKNHGFTNLCINIQQKYNLNNNQKQ